MDNKIKARISLILGIISVAFGAIECYIPIVIIGIVLGVIAIVFGALSFKSEFKNKSISGIILGATGIIIAAIWLYMIIIA